MCVFACLLLVQGCGHLPQTNQLQKTRAKLHPISASTRSSVHPGAAHVPSAMADCSSGGGSKGWRIATPASQIGEDPRRRVRRCGGTLQPASPTP